MLFMSLFFAGAGPIGEFLSIPDYWNPGYLVSFSIYTPVKTWTFGLEDWIGAFSSAGISTALYELLYPKRNSQRNSGFSARRFFILVGWSLVDMFLMLVLYVKVGVSGIQSMILSLIVTSGLIYFFHRGYFKTCIYASLVVASGYWIFLSFIFLTFFPNGIHIIWNSKGNLGLYLRGVPVEEMIWAFSSCFFVGPLFRLSFISETERHNHQYKVFNDNK